MASRPKVFDSEDEARRDMLIEGLVLVAESGHYDVAFRLAFFCGVVNPFIKRTDSGYLPKRGLGPPILDYE